MCWDDDRREMTTRELLGELWRRAMAFVLRPFRRKPKVVAAPRAGTSLAAWDALLRDVYEPRTVDDMTSGRSPIETWIPPGPPRGLTYVRYNMPDPDKAKE